MVAVIEFQLDFSRRPSSGPAPAPPPHPPAPSGQSLLPLASSGLARTTRIPVTKILCESPPQQWADSNLSRRRQQKLPPVSKSRRKRRKKTHTDPVARDPPTTAPGRRLCRALSVPDTSSLAGALYRWRLSTRRVCDPRRHLSLVPPRPR
ncbi:hypothetical protein EVAR_39312_1 [Eumeta japonica]|uniref:Uncharacterized protein n=1 Tax=Eumeta variegata TaxID=151549 RepID=A0A4C1VZ97_EUMVA|nr:hypothetical protein EVAR_39312_1 [Eumeta japonica]